MLESNKSNNFREKAEIPPYLELKHLLNLTPEDIVNESTGKGEDLFLGNGGLDSSLIYKDCVLFYLQLKIYVCVNQMRASPILHMKLWNMLYQNFKVLKVLFKQTKISDLL